MNENNFSIMLIFLGNNSLQKRIVLETEPSSKKQW